MKHYEAIEFYRIMPVSFSKWLYQFIPPKSIFSCVYWSTLFKDLFLAIFLFLIILYYDVAKPHILLTYISLMILFSIVSLDSCISLGKFMFKSSAHFYVEFSVFSFEFMSLWKLHILYKFFMLLTAIILFHCVSYLFTYPVVYFQGL